MAITGPASYIPTITDFLAHWSQCNAAQPPHPPLLIRLPAENVTVARAQLLALRDALQAQQITVQSRLTDQGIARGVINLKKTELLEQFNQFTTRLDASYRNTSFYEMRPYAPNLSDGQENFSRPLVDAMTRPGNAVIASVCSVESSPRSSYSASASTSSGTAPRSRVAASA